MYVYIGEKTKVCNFENFCKNFTNTSVVINSSGLHWLKIISVQSRSKGTKQQNKI